VGWPQVGLEPPLGFSVNDLEPTGELHELQHSAATASPQQWQGAEADPSPPLPPGSAPAPTIAALAPGVVGAAPSSLVSDPSASSEGQQLAAPSVDAASAHSEGANRAEHRRGGAAPFSTGITRRFG
jgi:hypothetical protein